MKLFRACLALCLALCLQVLPATAQDYRIQPGDVLRVEVLEDESLNREVLVLPDGRINMPLAGSVRAGGRTVGQVERALTSALARNFSLEPSVFVGVRGLAPKPEPRPAPEPVLFTIYVMGEAKSPGRLEVEPGTTILQLFAQMGGFTNFAAEKRIQLRRRDGKHGPEKIYQLNWKAIEAGRSSNGLAEVQDGDVIVVPQRRLFE